MRKSLIIAFALLVILSMSAMASDTRVTTMGDNNMILLDDANIGLFPSRLYDYPDEATAEFRNNNVTVFGVHWKFGEENPWVLGTYLHNGGVEIPAFILNDIPMPNLPQDNKRIDLIYSRMLGLHKFGFHFGLRHSSYVDDAEDDKDEACLSIYNFDFGLTPDGDKMDIAAGIEMITWSDKGTLADNSAYDITKPSGNMTFYARGRYFYEMDKTCTLVPHVELTFGKNEADFYDVVNNVAELTGTGKLSSSVFDLGCGLQYTPATNVLAVLDFGIQIDNAKTEQIPAAAGATTTESTDKTFTLPYFKVGFDAEVFSWLDVRLGATSYWNTVTDDQTTAKIKNTEKYPENTTYLGFGFHWNRLHVDVQTNPDLFINGFEFISGNGTAMNTRLSATYEW